MGSHSLHTLFSARSVAVFGASERPGSIGGIVFANLLAAPYQGELYAINPKHKQVQGRPCLPELEGVRGPVELAIIATPARTVPEIVRQCGKAGIRSVILLSSGFAESGPKGLRLLGDVLEEARRFGIHLLGPNSLGVMRPKLGLNATFSRNQALPGHLAFVSQSGALCTAVLDWALPRGIGFSLVATLGDGEDVDFGAVLDYLALDPETHGIVLYIEGVRNARRFLSGLRAAARLKPVTVLKAARDGTARGAERRGAGSATVSDEAFTAALERAGVVQVTSVSQLFASAQMLTRGLRFRGERLLILTNGAGPAVMAVDCAAAHALPLATLGGKTLDALDRLLPPSWSRANPVNILGDAPPERYRDALKACLADPGVDAALVMLTPQALTDAERSAESVIQVARETDKPLLACWMGDALVESARKQFDAAGLPQFRAPEAAVESLAYLVTHRRNQALLMQTPAALSESEPADVTGARLIIESARAAGRCRLNEREAKAVLAAFRIPTNPTILARTPSEAVLAAETLGFPVALKVSAPQVPHKTDIGGVRLNVTSAQTVLQQTNELMERVRAANPGITVEGVSVERMRTGPHLRELGISVVRDPVFGPLIAFGAGGVTAEVMQDRALALPPLNTLLAERMIRRTRICRLIEGFRNLPAVPLDAIEAVLLRVSGLACELPEVVELEINPLLVDENGVLAVDARIEVQPPPHRLEPYAHMAIHPYPAHLAQTHLLADGTEILIRPIRPEDAPLEDRFVRELSDESRFLRFMQALSELTPEMLVRFTQIDYDREMAFIALTEIDHVPTILGVARYIIQPDGESAEFAIVVADRWQQRGIGTRLMEALMLTARSKGLRQLEGEVLSRNRGMLQLANRLGFAQTPHPEDWDVVRVSRRL